MVWLDNAWAAWSSAIRRYDEAEALVVLGEAHQRAGRSADADRCWRQALIYYDDLGFTARTHEVRRRLA
jgi:hypothetical protein